ncbi:MAG: redoxin domain-containing protein, partial [Chloroflexota bacterium]
MRKLIGVFLGLMGALAVIVLPQYVQLPATTLTPQPTTLSATEEVVTNPAPYRNFGAAPEILDKVWLNTKDNAPLRLADLRGQVVLLEFWTFDCINCRNVLPHVRDMYNAYHDKGLTVIGVHYPEYGFEADYNNLVEALKRLDVPFPVAQDNDGATWNAWGQHYWPTVYLIDKQGNIRYQQIGEGG